MKHLIVLILLFLVTGRLAAQHSNSDVQTPDFVKDSLDAYVSRAMKIWQIPGVAICIVKDGQIVHQKAYGIKRWGEASKVDEHTVFPIASITKTFIGTALATLEAEKQVKLDQALVELLPSFQMKNKSYEAQITLADVLSHRSGWKTFQGDLLNTESSLSEAQMLQKFGLLEPTYPIRTRFGYSNFGYMLAGNAIKAISGNEWAGYLQTRFFAPLGMKRTLTQVQSIQADTNIARAHTLRDQQVHILDDEINPQAFGGIYAAVSDLGIWMKTLLDQGKIAGKQHIPETAIQKMWSSHTIIGKEFAADRNPCFKTYGLGWEIMQYHNHEIVQHNGAYAGTLTCLGLIPSLHLGIVVLCNQDGHMLPEALKWQVFDAYLGKKAPDYVQGIVERRQKRKLASAANPVESTKPVPIPLEVGMDALSGVYQNEVYGLVFIDKQKDRYVLRLKHHPNLQAELTIDGATTVTCTYDHPMFGKTKLPVDLAQGQVKGFTLFVDAFIEADGYHFYKIK
jgi:CubicO group peptidase (beta-lactamase class C family)